MMATKTDFIIKPKGENAAVIYKDGQWQAWAIDCESALQWVWGFMGSVPGAYCEAADNGEVIYYEPIA